MRRRFVLNHFYIKYAIIKNNKWRCNTWDAGIAAAEVATQMKKKKSDYLLFYNSLKEYYYLIII